MSQKKEIRTVSSPDAEIRAVGNSRQIEGYGIVFNSPSKDLGGFTEVVLPEAVDGVLENSDILALMNHDIARGVLARSSNGTGSMKLTVDKKGVKYSFEAPAFDLGNELIEGVRRGDIKESSFAFSIKEERWEKMPDDKILRTIEKFERIYDMSPVYNGAYEDTTVALRSMEEALKQEVPEVEEIKPVVEEPATEPVVQKTEEFRMSKEDLLLRQKQIIYNQKSLNHD